MDLTGEDLDNSEPSTPEPRVDSAPDPSNDVTPIGPIRREERVETIDILRGLALFGILAANFRGFAAPATVYFDPDRFWSAFPDRFAQAIVETLIQGKFITIFALLFGVGFAVQLERSRDHGGPFLGRYARRCLVLGCFGLMHGLFIWWGDILLPYALTGLLLPFFIYAKERTLLIWAAPLYLVPLGVTLLGGLAMLASGAEPVPRAEAPVTYTRTIEIYSEGNFAQIENRRVREVLGQNWVAIPVLFTQFLALFLVGMWCWRNRLFRPDERRLAIYRRLVGPLLTLGLLGNVTSVTIRWFDPHLRFPPSGMELLAATIRYFSVPILAAGYVLSVILICHSNRWRSSLRWCSPIGRSALSNYIGQALIGTAIFYSWGLGLYGSIGPAWLLAMTIPFFAAEAWISTLWMKRFRFGPLEWIWRTLTYGRVQPMLRS